MKRILSLLSPYFIFLMISYLTLSLMQMKEFANDPGVGWHLKTGEYILTNWSIPHTDPFTFSKEAKPWVSDQWLSDVLLYSMFEIGGWSLIYGVLTLIYLFTFFYLLYRTLSKYEEGEMSVLLSCFLALKLAAVHFILRPVIFSFLFFAITLTVAQKILSTKKISRAQWIGLSTMFFIWANMHPSFMLGLALLFLAWFQPVIERFFMGLNPPKRLVDKLVLLTGVCLLATFLNPYFTDLHRSIWHLGSSKYFMNLNQEWQPLRESSVFQIMLLGIFLGVLVSSAKSKLFPPFEVFSLVAFAHLALTATRFAPYFALVAALPFAKSCTALGQFAFIDKLPFLSFMMPSPTEDSLGRRRTGTLEFLALATLLLVCPLVMKVVPGYSGTYGPGLNYPYRAVQFLQEKAQATGKSVNVLAHPDLGGFIILAGNGTLKPYIDDRNSLHGEQAYQEYFQKFKPGPEWKDFVRTSGANYLLIDSDDALASFLESYERQSPLFRDENATIFAAPPRAE